MNIHQNARLTPQGRLLLVERITEAGWSVVQAAQAAGISGRQSYRWLGRQFGGGLALVEALSDMRERAERELDRPARRGLAGFVPIRDRLRRTVRFGVVMRHQLRLRARHLGKANFQQLCRLLVVLL